MKKILITSLILLLASAASTFAQCAMCRASVSSNMSEGRGMIGTGINIGILYMLSIPYLLIGTLIFLWYKTGKKELAQRLALQNRIKEIYHKG